jgi:nucleoside 2-deoxyribosyltransferase
MMVKTVYLAGTISADRETHEWRKQATKLLEQGMDVIDPGKSIYDRWIMRTAKGDHDNFNGIVQSEDTKLLLCKSRKGVMESDVVLVNFKIEPVGRPMIGTIMEIAWAWEHNIPIVAIPGEGFYNKHPMVRAAVTMWVLNLALACTSIREFFVDEDD